MGWNDRDPAFSAIEREADALMESVPFLRSCGSLLDYERAMLLATERVNDRYLEAADQLGDDEPWIPEPCPGYAEG